MVCTKCFSTIKLLRTPQLWPHPGSSPRQFPPTSPSHVLTPPTLTRCWPSSAGGATKRQNFNVNTQSGSESLRLHSSLNTTTKKDVRTRPATQKFPDPAPNFPNSAPQPSQTLFPPPTHPTAGCRGDVIVDLSGGRGGA